MEPAKQTNGAPVPPEAAKPVAYATHADLRRLEEAVGNYVTGIERRIPEHDWTHELAGHIARSVAGAVVAFLAGVAVKRLARRLGYDLEG